MNNVVNKIKPQVRRVFPGRELKIGLETVEGFV